MFRVAIATLCTLGSLAMAGDLAAQSPVGGGDRLGAPYGYQQPPGPAGTSTGQPGEYYAEQAVPARRYGVPTYGGGVLRPANCGEFRYWNGWRCADARLEPPYVGPR